MKKENKLHERATAFKEYFSVITKTVYTLNSISERNDMSRRLNSNIDRTLGYDEDSISTPYKFSNSEELDILVSSLDTDLEKIKSYSKFNFNLERIVELLKLNTDERYILYCLVMYSIYGDSMTSIPLRRLLELITLDDDIYINKHYYFEDDSKLMSSGLFMLAREPYSSGGILDISHTLISFINNKVLFAFLEKEDYNIIESVIASSSSTEDTEATSTKAQKIDRTNFVISPKDIVKELNKSVIGQHRAKKILSVHAYLHCLRSNGSLNVPFRSNIMMIGSTGVGKTYLVRTLADILGFPFARADVTTLTETGYVGDDVEAVLYDLYRNARGDLDLAQKGIVFLDEVDKIAKADAHQSTTGNPSDKAVQEALLSIMNGEDVKVPEFGDRRMMHSSEGISMNTKNILFIFGGAFVGLDEIIRMRLKGDSGLGFGAKNPISKLQKDKILSQVDVKDIEKYGMIPEFIGRIPIIVTLENLTKSELKEILLTSVDSPIIKYKEFLKALGKKFVVSDSALSFIVDKAAAMNMGARALKSIVETAMVNILFNLDGIKGNTLTLTKKDIEDSFDSECNDTEFKDVEVDATKKSKSNDKNFMA